MSDDLAYIRVMHFKIFGDCSLSIAILLDRFRDPAVAFLLVFQDG